MITISPKTRDAMCEALYTQLCAEVKAMNTFQLLQVKHVYDMGKPFCDAPEAARIAVDRVLTAALAKLG
jgi:hypothetical protein